VLDTGVHLVMPKAAAYDEAGCKTGEEGELMGAV